MIFLRNLRCFVITVYIIKKWNSKTKWICFHIVNILNRPTTLNLETTSLESECKHDRKIRFQSRTSKKPSSIGTPYSQRPTSGRDMFIKLFSSHFWRGCVRLRMIRRRNCHRPDTSTVHPVITKIPDPELGESEISGALWIWRRGAQDNPSGGCRMTPSRVTVTVLLLLEIYSLLNLGRTK